MNTILSYREKARYNILEEDESIFAFGDSSDARRIRQGTWDPESMQGQEKHAFVGSGYRLLGLGDKDEQSVPDISYDGYIWCGHAPVYDTLPIEEYTIPGVNRSPDERFLFEIRPKNMNVVFVADHQAFLDTREEMWQNRPSPLNPNRVSDAEMRSSYSARARTIVPITEYDGSYQQPIILVKFDALSYDEIQLVSGPWATLEGKHLRYW